MSWSSAFLDYISGARRGPEVWQIQVVQSFLEPGAENAGYTLTNVTGYGDAVVIASPPQVSGPRVTPIAWSSTVGSISVDLAGDLRDVLQRVTRGSTVVVRMGLAGELDSTFEVVAWGRVSAITGRRNEATLDIADALSAIDTRMDRADIRMFWSTPSSYLTADISASATTITVATTSGWLWDQNGAGVGVLAIDSELITFTGTTATTFTGCTRGQFGTSAAAHSTGAVVTGPAYLSGHPLDIARRLLLSQGLLGNSVWDDYPVSWGIGLDQTLVDIDDIDAWRSTVMRVASGTYSWDVVQTGSVDSAGSWLVSLLAPAGIFCTVRQGLLTVRCGVTPITVSSPPLVETAITDADILDGFGDFDTTAWSEDQPTEYATAIATTATGNTRDTSEVNVATFPAAYEYNWDASAVVWSNEAEVRTEMLNRLAPTAMRVGEGIRIRCAGMRLAQLAPCDVVYLTSSRVGLRFDYDEGVSGRRCLVLQVSPDWAANTVELRLLALPATSLVFE